MDPISISIELELATLIIAAVAGIATWMQSKHQKARFHQRERHHRQALSVLRNEEHTLNKLEVLQSSECAPVRKTPRRPR